MQEAIGCRNLQVQVFLWSPEHEAASESVRLEALPAEDIEQACSSGDAEIRPNFIATIVLPVI